MARQSEFYKGRRKKRNYALIPLVIIVLLIGTVIVLFYSLQKYATITEDEIKIELPLLASGNAEDTSGVVEEAKTFEDADIQVIIDDADYSSLSATAGKRVSSLRAIYIPYEDLNTESIDAYANRLSSGNALLFELKREDGYIAWYSDSAVAYAYGLNMTTTDAKQNLIEIVDSLKDRDIYLVAQISCLQDELLGAHCTTVNLRNAYGSYYYDENGYWLDPYSQVLRDYTVQLVQELYDIGFDEVVLSNFSFPVITDEMEEASDVPLVNYTMEMSSEPTPADALASLAVYLNEQLADRETDQYLSVYVDSTDALAGTDEKNGQSVELFLKLFDRVYYNTDRYAYTFNVEDVRSAVSIGRVEDRFVPVVINYLPDNTTWVLVDYEE